MADEEILEEEVIEETNDEGQDHPVPYEGEVPFGYELYTVIWYDENGIEQHTPQIRECSWTPEERIQHRIVYLRNKLILGTITAEEREELKLLVG